MDYAKESLKMHYDLKGKLEIKCRAAVDSKDALSLAYTPGVAQPCLEIQKDINKSYELTRRWNTVAVVTDGTAVLGLGDIGPEAGMPVMEGKCVLFKAFGETFANTYADKIQFASLPLYIYAELPDLPLFQGASYGGNIKAYYGKKTDPNDENEKPSKVGTAEASLLDGNIALRGMPELTKDANGFVNVKLPGQAINFQDAFNLAAPEGSGTEGSSLCIDYNIKLNGAGNGELTITPEKLENASSTSISIDIVLLLTLQFNVTADIPIDLMEIMKKDDGSGTPKTDQEKDLFKRSSKTSMEDYQKYIDVVKSAELEFYKPKFPIKSSGGMSLTVDWGSGQRTECVLKDDTNALIAVNPSTLLNTYPLEPSIKLVIGKGSFGLPRDMEMETRLKLRVKAEGPIQIYPFAGQEAH